MSVLTSVERSNAQSLSAYPDGVICSMATNLSPEGVKTWKITASATKYQAEAKRRNIDCIRYEQRRPKGKAVKETSPLKAGFQAQRKDQRRSIQLFLSNLGYYESTIDGVYGQATAEALIKYNKKYRNDADLTKKSGVTALITQILNSPSNNAIEVKAEIGNLGSEQSETNQLSVHEAELETQAETQKMNSVSETPMPDLPDIPAKQVKPILIADMQTAYESGNYNSARQAAEKLAVEGEADAQYLLGKMYAEGLGALQINKTAHMWLNIASLNGSSEAITARNVLADIMTPSSVEEAQELALKCIQSKYANCGLSITPNQTHNTPQPRLKSNFTGAELRNNFKTQSALKRKQLQYALKKLGVYSSSIDGIWGQGTSGAFTNYIKINDLDVSSADAVFASVLSKVEVPTSFATPKRRLVNKKPANSNRNTNTAGLRAIIDNPSVTGAQAKAICKPQAEMARRNARSVSSSSMRTRCTGYGYGINCNSYSGPQSPGEGIALGIANGLLKRKAREATMAACLAQYGWRE